MGGAPAGLSARSRSRPSPGIVSRGRARTKRLRGIFPGLALLAELRTDAWFACHRQGEEPVVESPASGSAADNFRVTFLLDGESPGVLSCLWGEAG